VGEWAGGRESFSFLGLVGDRRRERRRKGGTQADGMGEGACISHAAPSSRPSPGLICEPAEVGLPCWGCWGVEVASRSVEVDNFAGVARARAVRPCRGVAMVFVRGDG
jgi:hypothetical protein